MIYLEEIPKFPLYVFSKLIKSPIEIEFRSVVVGNPPGSGKLKYLYLAKNFSDRTVYFKWTSLLHPEFPGGWSGTLEPGKGTTFQESIVMRYGDLFKREFWDCGPPIEINDVVVFNSESPKYFPSLENLGLIGDLEDRIAGNFDDGSTIGLANLPSDDINTIFIAPAFVPREWVQPSKRD